jgi:hypothetical protein
MATFCLAAPALASAAPQPVGAWYMYSTSPSALKSEAYYHGYNFARRHPGGTRLMVLDFGAARKVGSGTWGSVSFGSPSTAFSNAEILSALRAAADGIHDGYVWGMTIVAYGNSNYHMSNSGMSGLDAYFAGYYQSQRSSDLAAYQRSRNYNKQGSAVASDIEPSWESAAMSKRLVDGVSDQGWALLYNFGSADGCPLGGRGDGLGCNNGWTVGDVAYVSYHGSAVPLPEIYYLVNADQWTYIRNWWNKNYGIPFTFWGATAEVASGVLTPAQSWSVLNDRNPGAVYPELICFGY